MVVGIGVCMTIIILLVQVSCFNSLSITITPGKLNLNIDMTPDGRADTRHSIGVVSWFCHQDAGKISECYISKDI